MSALRIPAALASGLLFGVGLGLAGMTDPRKVMGFLDVGGTWDPSLAFTMGGALVVASIAFALIRRRERPVLDDAFHMPTRRDLDVPLVAGSAVFGIGWGLAGYCPGPAVASLAGPLPDAAIFVAAMVAGMLGKRLVLDRWLGRSVAVGSSGL